MVKRSTYVSPKHTIENIKRLVEKGDVETARLVFKGIYEVITQYYKDIKPSVVIEIPKEIPKIPYLLWRRSLAPEGGVFHHNRLLAKLIHSDKTYYIIAEYYKASWIIGTTYYPWYVYVFDYIPEKTIIPSSTPVNPYKIIIYTDNTIEVKAQYWEVSVEGDDHEFTIPVSIKLTNVQKVKAIIFTDSIGRIFVRFENEKIYCTFERRELPKSVEKKVFENVNLMKLRFGEVEKEVELTPEELKLLGIDHVVSYI